MSRGRTRKPARGRNEGRKRPEKSRAERGGNAPRGQRPPRAERPGRPQRPPRKDRPPRAEHVPEIVSTADMGRMLAGYGFRLTPPQLDLLVQFHKLLLEWNRKLNLTRILNLEDMVLKHYVDCMIILRYLPELPSPLLDMGTGGGFPGIPLKILSPDTHIILGEGVRKRVNFLRVAREEMGLEKLDIIGRNIDKDFEYPVQGVITRAVMPIRDTLKRISSCLQVGGMAAFMKGPNVDPEKEDARRKYGDLFEEERDIAYNLPSSDHRRRLVLYRKVRPA